MSSKKHKKQVKLKLNEIQKSTQKNKLNKNNNKKLSKI